MANTSQELFTTEQVVELLGLKPKDKWRVIKFAESKEYDISPARVMGKGLGSRRLYDLENVCQIALALALLEAGLRPPVIGDSLERLGKMAHQLKNAKRLSRLFIVVTLEQRFGSLLSAHRFLNVEFVEDGYKWSHDDILGQLPNISGHENYSVLFVPIGSVFSRIKRGLEETKGSQGST